MKSNPINESNMIKYVYIYLRIQSGITGYRLDYRLELQVIYYHSI